MRDLAAAMGRATGAPVHVARQYVVTSDSPVCLQALETLLGEPSRKQLPAPQELPTKRKYTPRAGKVIARPVDGGFLPGPAPTAIIEGRVLGPGEGLHGKSPLEYKPVKLAPAPLREIKAWHVIIDNRETEIITISEKNRRLAAGEFEAGTILRHPKAGNQCVTGPKGQPQGMEPA